MDKERLIAEFNRLHIPDMPEITELNPLKGDFINLEYTLQSGQKIKLWDDSKTYLGNEVCRAGGDRCYGLATDGAYLLVCEYGNGGSKPEIVLFKRL